MQRLRSFAGTVFVSVILALWAAVPRGASLWHSHAGGDRAHVHLEGYRAAHILTPHAHGDHQHHAVEPEPWEDGHDHTVDHSAPAIGTQAVTSWWGQIAAAPGHAHAQDLFLPALVTNAVALHVAPARPTLLPGVVHVAVARPLPPAQARGPPQSSSAA